MGVELGICDIWELKSAWIALKIKALARREFADAEFITHERDIMSASAHICGERGAKAAFVFAHIDAAELINRVAFYDRLFKPRKILTFGRVVEIFVLPC